MSGTTYESLVGVSFVVLGTYMFLVGSGRLSGSKKTADPEKVAEWRQKWGRTVMLGGALAAAIGALRIFLAIAAR
jgi:hypothetical protein